MVVSSVLLPLTFAGIISAFAIRNEPQLDPTAGIVETSTATILPGSPVASSRGPKFHGETNAHVSDISATGSDGEIRIHTTATDFNEAATTSTESRVSREVISFIDIGSIIQTLVTTTLWAIPTVHFENPATGWEDITSTIHYESSATGWTSVTQETVHWESSASGWDRTDHEDLAPHSTTYRTVEVTDDPRTHDLQPSQTTTPTGPSVKEVSSKTITDFPPPPAITHDGVTVRPIAVTRNPTVTLPDGAVTTTEKVEFQVAIGSSTLSTGNPITINNVVFDITVNTAGRTVLHAGDLTTTLPQPTAGEIRTVVGDTIKHLSILTAVVRGTTMYILAGQTLAPGQPVTLGGTPVSIATSGGETVLYVGDKTTTLSGVGGMQTLTDWSSTSTGTQKMATKTEPAASDPTSKNSAAKRLNTAFACSFVGIALFTFTCWFYIGDGLEE